MNTLNAEHWLQHEREHHAELFVKSAENADGGESVSKPFVYTQLTASKANAENADATLAATSASSSSSSISTTHNFASFSQFLEKHKSLSGSSSNGSSADNTSSADRMLNCLICGAECRFAYTDLAKHYQAEHEFNVFDVHLGLGLADLDLVQQLSANGLVQLNRGVHLKRRASIPAPKVENLDKELSLLNAIYQEQIVEKQIVSWLNAEQFYRRAYNYDSHVCIVCNASKVSILDAHYMQSVSKTAPKSESSTSEETSSSSTNNSSSSSSSKQQYFSEEMRTVVLTNHVLGHFNEYCYRCMSCKISWPDRTQLLKHAQECSNSQVVRTKTKYKLKANCRMQLKFNLQSFIEYWQHEKCVETRQIEEGAAAAAEEESAAVVLVGRVYIKDVFKSKQLLLDLAAKHSLNTICADVDHRLVLGDVSEESGGENQESTGATVAQPVTGVGIDKNSASEATVTAESSQVSGNEAIKEATTNVEDVDMTSEQPTVD